MRRSYLVDSRKASPVYLQPEHDVATLDTQFSETYNASTTYSEIKCPVVPES